jgi:Tol biopolymer transport system component/DNA-binding winged helix-turn-helix (wHTH) protein
MLRYSFGPFELDPEARLLRRDGEPIALVGKTLDTLTVLIENRGRLVDKEELLSRVWAGSVVEEANLTQTIFTVRKILGDSPKDHRYIATVAGRGYQFVAPVIESTTTVPATGRPLGFRGINRFVSFGIAGALIAVLIGIVLWRARIPGNDQTQGLQLSRFTSYPGVETMPAFSPDGKEIAYVRAEHDPFLIHIWKRQVGQANIYTKLVGAGTELRLTNHPGADYYPAWSPDGQYIGFYRDEPRASGFYIVSALGGQERRITKEEEEISGIAWLPDGRHLLVSHFFEGSHSSPLVKISLDTGQQHPMTSPPAGSLGDAFPAISPDGTRLAFLRFKDTDAVDVCLTPLSENRVQCWQLQGNWPQGLAWTPSGDGIIVSAVLTGPSRLWRYRRTGGSPVALTSGEEEAALPTVSRQGNQLAYVLSRRNIDLMELDVDSSMPVNAAGARRVAWSTRIQSDPAFSADGRKIAYHSDRSGSQEIWVTDTDTHTSIQLTHFGGPPTGSPSWSPDGLEIAFDSEQPEGTAIFAISADGGMPRRITPYTGDNCVPSWSQDGKFVYFASSRSGQFQIWKVFAATGETSSNPALQVTHGGGFRAFETVDGKYLYYTKGRGTPGLWRRSLWNGSGGKEEPVLNSVQEWGWWALGPGVVYFLEMSDPARVHLKMFDIAERWTRELAILPYPVQIATPTMSASRDGRHLVYTQVDSMEAVIMLAENFR